jgi:septum site-determining protein MinD
MVTISFSSGKGGTGKTLLVSALAELLSRAGYRVLAIDLDISVRGLTSLLYFQNQEMLNLERDGKLSVADFLVTDRLRATLDENGSDNLGINRYHQFDVLPAVPKIDTRLRYQDITPNTVDMASERLLSMMRRIDPVYDLVLLDCRAGYDEVVAAAHGIAQSTICVEEQDPISRITADNLIRELDDSREKRSIYRIVNKALVEEAPRHDLVGSIPFDIDIMNRFGTSKFWVSVSGSMLEPALIEAWNAFCRREGLRMVLSSARRSPIPLGGLEKRIGRLPTFKRVALVYGLFLAAFGLPLSLGGREMLFEFSRDPIRAFGLISTFVGLVFVLYSVIGSGDIFETKRDRK